MLDWNTKRPGIELYINLDGKAALKYMDELIRLFRKARLGSPESFQNEEVKNKLLAGLPFEVMEISHLDLAAAEIENELW